MSTKADKKQSRRGRPGPRTKWKPGQSGNPKGRKPGTGVLAPLRAAIEARVPAIIEVMAQKALEGDTAAARLLMERTYAPKREEPVQFPLPEGSLTDKGRAILAAVSDGTLTPAQGSQLLSALAGLVRVKEIDELAARVAALEEGVKDGKQQTP